MPTDEELDEAILRRGWALQLEPGTSRTFETFNNLNTFVADEVSRWGNSPVLSQEIMQLREATGQLAQARTSSRYEDNLDAAWKLLKQGEPNLIYPSSTRGQFLEGLAKHSPSAIKGAADFLRRSVGELQNPDYIAGVVAATMFAFPGSVSSSLAAQVQSLEVDRSSLMKAVKDGRRTFESLQTEASTFRSTSGAEIKEAIQADRKEFQGHQADWIAILDATKTEFSEAKIAAITEMAALRKTYDEHLTLQEPAMYWHDLEAEYRGRGFKWVIATSCAVVAMVAFVSAVVYNPPQIFNSEKLSLPGLKGALLLRWCQAFCVNVDSPDVFFWPATRNAYRI